MEMAGGSCSLLLLLLTVLALSHAQGRGGYATHNGYRMAFTDEEFHSLNLTNDFQHKSCSLKQVQLLARHGSRAPTKGHTERLANITRRINANSRWNRVLFNPFNISDELTEAGAAELKSMGERYLHRYRALFGSNNSSSAVFVTSKQRTKDSAMAFLAGVSPATYISQEDNVALRFFETCHNYKMMVETSAFKQEYYACQRLPEYEAAAQRVRDYFNATDSILTKDDVIEIYDFCGILHANNEDTSLPWCEALEGVDLTVLEYATDLLEYYKKSYGETLNYEISCPFMKKMLENLEQAARGDPKSDALVLNFAHAETLLPVLTALELYKDTPKLSAARYGQYKEARQFRTGRVSPFAGNVAVLLWDCGASGEGLKVQVVANERVESSQPCSAVPCSYEEFTRRMRYYASCDFNGLCSMPTNGALPQGQCSPMLLLWTMCLTIACFWKRSRV